MPHEFPEDFLRPDHRSPLADIDESFIFDFTTYADELGDHQRWSRWEDLEALMKGPEPRPDWVVTSSGAIDTDLGILKTGKEADVFLLERGDPAPHRRGGRHGRQALSRHRPPHLPPRRSYTEGRSMKRSRDNRALKRKSTWGKQVAAGEWAISEWNALRRCWELGLPVPYPVQIDETEILMEWITHDGETAPRVSQVRPDRSVVEGYYEQLRDAMSTLAQAGLVHGDLSPYNTLAAGDRLVIIDLPQMVDLVGNPRGHGLPAARLRQHGRLVPLAGARHRRARPLRGADGARVLGSPREAHPRTRRRGHHRRGPRPTAGTRRPVAVRVATGRAGPARPGTRAARALGRGGRCSSGARSPPGDEEDVRRAGGVVLPQIARQPGRPLPHDALLPTRALRRPRTTPRPPTHGPTPGRMRVAEPTTCSARALHDHAIDLALAAWAADRSDRRRDGRARARARVGGVRRRRPARARAGPRPHGRHRRRSGRHGGGEPRCVPRRRE